MFKFKNAKYTVLVTSKFKKNYKQVKKQNKDIEKLISVVEKLANGEDLSPKYRDHFLKNNKYYKDCKECHIEPDWLLIYQIKNENLILLLLGTGSHSEMFDM